MSHKLNPRQVVQRLMDGISNQQWSELHLLFSEDAVIKYPFALPEPRELKGRAAIQAYFASVTAFPLELRARELVMHEIGPNTLVVEWDYDALVTTTRHTFVVSNIQVTTIRDGLIVESRDYHNHAVLARAIGRTS